MLSHASIFKKHIHVKFCVLLQVIQGVDVVTLVCQCMGSVWENSSLWAVWCASAVSLVMCFVVP